MKTKLTKLLFALFAVMVGTSMNAQATSGSCGTNAAWSYEGTTLTISGTGAMDDYTYGEAPWYADYASTMTSLVIEDGITSIGNNAFAGCEKLNSVTYPASGFTSIGDYAFSGAKVKQPNLPRTLTHLGTGAFAGSQAKGVSIPASLKKIPDYAFEGCANLEGVGIFEGVEEIGESAFDGCAFSVITIPNTVKTIGTGAFMSNTALESVYIGTGVKTIGNAAFQGCTALKKVGIGGNSKPTLGDAVFTEYDGSTPLDIEAFYVPYGVNYDGWGGFDSGKFETEMLGTWTNSGGSELGSGNWRFDILEGRLTVTGTGQLNVAPWNDEPAINPIVYQDYEHPGFWGGIKSAVFGSGITSLENMACGMQINCASVTLPNTLKTITNSALEECAFTSIDLPEGLETIDMYAFFGSKLTSVVIPSTVTKLGYSAFLYNEDLAVVTMLPTTPPTLEPELPFGQCDALTAIYVPAGCADTYKTTGDWSTYAALIQEVPTTTFTYTATEKIAKFDDNLSKFQGAISVKSHEFDGTNGTVVYEGYVTGLGELALSYAKMTSITIPASVTSIGSGAFQSSKLTSVTLAGTTALKTIGVRAFSSCSELTAFTVPATVETIGASAFSGCSKLETFTFDGTPTVTSIGNAAFQDCKKLTTFTIPASVTTLGRTVFWYTGLTSLNIPAGVTSIGQALFCASPVTSLTIDAANPKYADLGYNGVFEKDKNKLIAGGAATTIPDGITTIGQEAFWGEEGEFSLFLPESVTAIEERAFHMARGLKTLAIPSGITYIDGECFAFCEGTKDVYCYVDAADITWDGGMEMPAFNLMDAKSTKFHVTDADAWSTKFPDANVTFVGDLVATRPATHAVEKGGVTSNWSTYYNSTQDVVADANTEVYQVSLTGTALTLTKVDDRIINEGQGVVLKSTDANIVLLTSDTQSATSYATNSLAGTDTQITNPGNAYVLGYANSILGFYKLSAGGTIKAHKAYLTYAGGGAPEFFDLDGNVTGITNTNLSNQTNTNGAVYTLDGRRVSKPTKGLYIVNGKKVVIK